jgi:hypothetical protein
MLSFYAQTCSFIQIALNSLCSFIISKVRQKSKSKSKKSGCGAKAKLLHLVGMRAGRRRNLKRRQVLALLRWWFDSGASVFSRVSEVVGQAEYQASAEADGIWSNLASPG